MLNADMEKSNNERLIIRDEIAIKSLVASPFESPEDIALSGDFTNVKRKESSFFIKNDTSYPYSTHNHEDYKCKLKENIIENAIKDLRKFPNNPFLLNNLGLAYLNNSELDEALIQFKKARKIKNNFAVAELNIAITYEMKKEKQSALESYHNILKNNPQDHRALINIADIYLKNNELEKAKEILEDIIRQNPNNISSRNKIAIIDLIKGKYNQAISELRKCLQIKNNLPSLYNNLGVAYGLIGLYKKAITSFNIALSLSRNYPSAIANLATALNLQNKTHDSIKIIEDYLEKNENCRIRELLSRLYLNEMDFKQALKNLKIVLSNEIERNASNQQIARLHNNIGVIYYNIKDFKNAEDSFITSLTKAESISPALLYNIIDLYFSMSKTNKAKIYIDMLKEKFGEGGLYLFYEGLLSFYNNEIPHAIECQNTFLAVIKNFAPSYSLLGYIYSEYLYDYGKAIDLFREGYKYIPEHIGILNNLAYNYLMNNDISKAKDILNKVKHISNIPYLNATRGLLKIKENNLEDGISQYDYAATLAPSEFLRKQILQKKHIEIARFYLLIHDFEKAKSNLLKALSIKIENSIYTKQANELYEKCNMKLDHNGNQILNL